jgi:hypothetical protein
MTKQEIIVGQVWRRREPVGDEYDTVKIVGRVDFAGQREDEWTLSPIPFGSVIQSASEGIVEYCELLSEAPEPDDWTAR